MIRTWGYKTCLQTFCNPSCSNYTPLKNTKKYKEKWRKSIKNGFNKTYTQEQIDNHKKKGCTIWLCCKQYVRRIISKGVILIKKYYNMSLLYVKFG